MDPMGASFVGAMGTSKQIILEPENVKFNFSTNHQSVGGAMDFVQGVFI